MTLLDFERYRQHDVGGIGRNFKGVEAVESRMDNIVEKQLKMMQRLSLYNFQKLGAVSHLFCLHKCECTTHSLSAS